MCAAEMIKRKWWLDSGLLIHFVFVWTRPFPWNFEKMEHKRSEVNLGVREKIIFPPQYYDPLPNAHLILSLSSELV